MIRGESGSGKSMSARDFPNHERIINMICDSNKKPPFRNKFKNLVINDPMEVLEYFDDLQSAGDKYDAVLIDTATFLMQKYETQHVLGSSNGQVAWGNYAQFFKILMEQKCATSPTDVVVYCHSSSVFDAKKGQFSVSAPVKGSLKDTKLEAYFTTVISAKNVELDQLEPYTKNNPLLNITERDIEIGNKYVFQTRVTKDTVGEIIKSPEDLFTKEETFIDNNVYAVLERLKEYYNN
jgi:hypothetical protein